MANYLATNTFPGTGAVMQIAISFAGNRPDNSSGTIPYFDAKDVKAEIVKPATSTTNEVVTPITLTQVNATTFKTSVIVPVGSNLRVYRETLVSYPMVDFADRQTVTENDLDTSSRQVLYAAMEALDKSTLAIEYARQGLTFAVTAVNTANTALGRADFAVVASNQAVDTANAASATAGSAVTTANGASAAAAQAAKDAAAAEKHATNVETLAAQAQAASAAATTTANNAKTTAEGIDAKATSALQNASTAVSTANAAKTTAEGIDGKAQSAIDTANDASTKAASAKATAEGIDAKATAAQSSATSANTKADTAISTANQAKNTADAQASAVAKAQGDATAAANAAASANSNANGRVAKAGDTMTGELAAPSFKAGQMLVKDSLLRSTAGSWTAGFNGAAWRVTGVTNYEIVPGNNNSAQYVVYKDDGTVRGNWWNSAQGSWILRVGNGTEHVFNFDGSIYHKTNYVYKFDASGQDRQMLCEGRNIVTYGPELVSGIVPNISGANGNHYAGAAVKVTNAGNDSASATMIFHREGRFACFFGLDVDNELAYGGYSYGTVRYRIWSERNFNPAEYVRFDNLRQELGGRGAGEVGTYAFLQTVDGNNRNPGDLLGGGGLKWSSHNAVGGTVGGGTWRCMGYGNNGGVTLWLRVN